MIYEEVFMKLNQRGIQYAVIGGVAALLHGVTRLTVDLDIVCELSPENIDKLFAALREIEYLPRVPVTAEQFKDPKTRRQWKRGKGMKAFSFFNNKNPLKMIDIFMDENFSYKRAHKKIFRDEGVEIPTISIEDLKRLKRRAGRPKDLADIESLKKIQKIKKERKK